MRYLFEFIFSRYRSDDGAALSRLLGKKGTAFPGLYLGDRAPEGAPYPLVTFHNPSGGVSSPSFPAQQDTTLERTRVQFSIFADTQEQVINIMDEIRRCYDRTDGTILGPEGGQDRKGVLVRASRQGPGIGPVSDPESGWDGFIDYMFTYTVE